MILTCWLNSTPDPHYKRTLDADISQVTLLNSAPDALVLSDCLAGPNVIPVSQIDANPYFARWQHIADWCEHRDEFVWCVDAGDVTLLNDPYPDWLDNDTLYIGSEPVDGPNERSVGFWWVEAMHPAHGDWIAANRERTLLNPGLLGGHTSVVAAFARQVLAGERDGDKTDMVAANRAAYTWHGPVVTGAHVHTPMWSFVQADPTAIWAHKAFSGLFTLGVIALGLFSRWM